jgi:hypothetical protein
MSPMYARYYISGSCSHGSLWAVKRFDIVVVMPRMSFVIYYDPSGPTSSPELRSDDNGWKKEISFRRLVSFVYPHASRTLVFGLFFPRVSPYLLQWNLGFWKVFL